MTGDLTFTDLVDFLSDCEGQQVYVEVGTRDQESRERHTDEFITKIHGHRLGAVQDSVDPDVGGERKAVMVMLYPAEVLPGEEKNADARLFFNPRRIAEIQGDPGRALKVWRDDGVYIGINPS